ncbi:MAG: hypothetical protein ACTSQE_01595 [Candidatus Heimdallarchaeaceae archaeon]
MKKNIITILFLTLILFSTKSFTIYPTYTMVSAGSSSSGDIPPPGGEGEGGDTGGGSASGGLYLNYRIPLVFKEGPFAPSLISITALSVFQNETIVLFGYNSTLFEDNQAIIKANETLIIDPREEPELTNGSLIQSFAPLQITVYHPSSGKEKDDTFSYSVLVMQNWGKRYQSSFSNSRAIVIAGFNDTEISINSPGEEIEKKSLHFVGDSLDLEVTNGSIIEANGPIGVVFYSLSQETGSYTYTGIPYYMWGKEYYALPPPELKKEPSLEDQSQIVLGNINEGGVILVETDYGNTQIEYLTENITTPLSYTDLEAGDSYTHFITDYANYSLTILYKYEINNTVHKSAVQYMSVKSMKWAEWFYTSQYYSNLKLKTVSLDDENIILPIFLYEDQLSIDIANYSSLNRGDYFSYQYPPSYGIAAINGSCFTVQLSSAPENMVWNSSANLLFPLNLYSFVDNTSTNFPSWYRFPNINIKEVKIFPSEPTELRKIKMNIMVQNNGSIPSAPFWVTVYVNDTLKIHKKLDGLDINDTFDILYEEFQGFGLKTINVSIYTDSLSQIFELIEFDNSLEIMIEIHRNWNIIYVSIAIGTIIVGYVSFRLGKRIWKGSKARKRKFDLILSEIEV